MINGDKMSCPICATNATFVGISGITYSFDCPICGHFKILSRVFEDIKAFPKHILSGVARNYWEMNQAEFHFSDKTCESEAAFFKAVPFAVPGDTDIPAKANLILRHLQRKTTYPGEIIILARDQDYSIGFCHNGSEFDFCIGYLRDLKLIENVPDPHGGIRLAYRITPSGWATLAGIGAEAKDQGFIAMAFRLPTSDVLHTHGLNPGIENAGYKPQRIDRKEHNNRIDDEIVAEIRKSKFVVADLTGNNPGAYYEAGFAQGLGRPVIWTCEKKQLDAKDIHFDVRQYSVVTWEPDNLDDFAKRLTQRIEATIGHGRYVVDAK